MGAITRTLANNLTTGLGVSGKYTQSSVLTPLGSSIEFTGIPSGTNSIILKSYAIQWAGTPGDIGMVIGDSGGY